ncbi:MAG: hypothetical protein KatS3mg131_3740 [Candidatus Tectimicrobiota bacterium]|nr:MAG: hypothetical protein KatS3mg131_3740 [Candidatus Tectomicrobia bacterium]
MARLKHIAIATQDPDKTAAFYRDVFDLQEVSKITSPLAEGYYLSDGHINIAVLRFKSDEAADVPEGAAFVGLHHFGFQVDDLAETLRRLEKAGAQRRQTLHQDAAAATPRNVEIKFKGPDGVIFDVSASGWVGTD